MSTDAKTTPSNAPSTSSSSLGGVFVKILLVLIVLALGVVGALYAAGGNEIQLVVTKEISAKKKDIYKLMTDPESVKKWVEGVKKIEPLGDITEHKTGARSKITVEVEGTEIEMEDEVTFARTDHETEIKMTSEMFDVVQRFKLDFKDGAGLSSEIVVLTQTYKCKFKGMYRLMAPFAKTAIEEQLNKNLEALKKLAEGEGEDGADDKEKADDKAEAKSKKKSDSK